MYALVITSHRSGQETCHVKSTPTTNASMIAPTVSEHSKERTWVNPPAVFSYPALKARASKLLWLSSESWLWGLLHNGRPRAKYTPTVKKAARYLYLHRPLKALVRNWVPSCTLHYAASYWKAVYAPNCLQSEPGKWKDREGESFAENDTADQLGKNRARRRRFMEPWSYCLAQG